MIKPEELINELMQIIGVEFNFKGKKGGEGVKELYYIVVYNGSFRINLEG